MSTHLSKIGTLQIASGAANSAKLSTLLSAGQMKVLGTARSITIHAPAALTGAVKVGVSYDGGTTFTELNEDGTDVSVPAGDARVIFSVGWDDLRLQSAANEAANRDFVLFAQLDTAK